MHVQNQQHGRWREDTFAALVWLALSVAAMIAIGWIRSRHGDAASALFGFHPSSWLHPVWDLPQFDRDFPNGEADALRSLIGQAYKLMGNLPFSDRVIVSIMVTLEASTLAAGAMVATKAVHERIDGWRLFGTALFLCAGTLFSCDLARWFHPFYGTYYNFANGAGMAAFGLMIWRRPLASGLALGLTIAMHPIIGGFFGMAVIVAGIARRKEVGLLRLAVAGCLAILIGGGWNAMMIGATAVAGGQVDSDLYIGLTKMLGSHWYPISLGVFGHRSWETLLPFMGVALLFSASIKLSIARHSGHAILSVAVLVLIAFSLIGALVAEYSNVPMLVKLALHRASAVALLLAGVALLPRLLADLVEGWWPLALLAGWILIEAFWRNHGPPIVPCIAYSGLATWRLRRADDRAETWFRVAATAIVAAITLFLFVSGTLSSVWLENAAGLNITHDWPFLAALALILLGRVSRQAIFTAVAVAIGLWIWLPSLDPMRDPAMLAKATAFLDVQEWAREHTDEDSLFMTNPQHGYGWRHHSQRPSFGTAREWLYTSWGYNTDPRYFAKGLDRAASIGLVVEKYLAIDRDHPSKGAVTLQADVARFYARITNEQLAALAERYRIDYFVFAKDALDRTFPATVFENDGYAVIAARDVLSWR